jgi:hypothetical protein
MEEHYKYIRIFGCSYPPHMLPKYVLDKFIGNEISYHTVEVRITRTLFVGNKII